MRPWRCCLASAPLARTRQQPAQHRPLPPQSRRPPYQMVRGSPPRPDHPLIRLRLWAGRRPHRRVQELWSLTSSIPLRPYRSHDRLFTRSRGAYGRSARLEMTPCPRTPRHLLARTCRSRHQWPGTPLPLGRLFRQLSPLERSHRQQGASTLGVCELSKPIALRRLVQAIFTGFHLPHCPIQGDTSRRPPTAEPAAPPTHKIRLPCRRTCDQRAGTPCTKTCRALDRRAMQFVRRPSSRETCAGAQRSRPAGVRTPRDSCKPCRTASKGGGGSEVGMEQAYPRSP